MKYINKNKREKEFNSYSIAFLKRAKRHDGTFSPLLADTDAYAGFSRRTYKQKCGRQRGWLSLLLEEQGYRCCYCMKRLRADEVSVEHLVPERFTGLDEGQEYAFYCAHSERIRNYVELGSRFDQMVFGSGASLDNLTKIPHMIAHSNLFASCLKRKSDGEVGCSCNNRRGNRRILPLMLIPDIADYVFYEKSGEISILFSDIESVELTMRHLGLNGNTLRQIRHLWYLASRSGVTINELNSFNEAERIDFLLQVFHRDEIWKLPREYQKYASFGQHGEDAYWRLFLQYDWFYIYYQRHFG